jgi:hypothetical protein
LDYPRTTASKQLESFETTFRVQDILTQEPLSGVVARLCRKLDTDCVVPESTSISDVQGNITFDVPASFTTGFSGYVLLSRDDLLPCLYFFDAPIIDDRKPLVVQLSTLRIATLLANQIGVDFAPDRGVVLLSAVDCQDEAAAGVSYTSNDDAATTFYSIAGLPNTKATATDANGFGGLLNVRSGPVTISARVGAAQRLLASVELLVRAGAVTYSRVVPLGD